MKINDSIITQWNKIQHNDVSKWKHSPRYWPFVRGIHRSSVNSQQKDQRRGALMFSLTCALNKRLSNQSLGWWFETPTRSLWRHCNESTIQWWRSHEFECVSIRRRATAISYKKTHILHVLHFFTIVDIWHLCLCQCFACVLRRCESQSNIAEIWSQTICLVFQFIYGTFLLWPLMPWYSSCKFYVSLPCATKDFNYLC